MSFTKVKIVLLVLIVYVFSVTLNAEFTKEMATDLVLNQICGDKLDQVNIYSAKVTRSNSQIDIFRNYEVPIAVNYSNYYLYYVDNTPNGFYGAYNEYVIIDIVSGDYQVFIRDWCPDDMRPHNYLSNYDLIHYVNDPEDYYTSRVEFIENTSENISINNNAYAVIIKPRFNDDFPGTEITHFWNDVSFLYSTLKMKGYTDDNIILLYDNDGISEYGNDFDGDYSNDIDFACTEPNINIVFDELSGLTNNYPEIPELVQNNTLSFFSVGTGSPDWFGNPEDKVIYCWNMPWNPPGTQEYIFPEELSEMLSNVNCGYMNIVLGQDYSGNFVEDIVDINNEYNYLCKNRTIVTSTGIDQGNRSGAGGGWSMADYSAEGWITDCLFSEFYYYYISAIRGYYPFIEFEGTIAVSTTPWLNGAVTGEFDFNGFPHMEDFDFYPDINNDECISTLEAFNYMQAQHCEVNFDYLVIPYNNYLPYYAYREINPIVELVTQSGFTEDYFCFTGFAGQVINALNIVDDVILSEIGLNVINSSIIISPSLNIFLSCQSQIAIDELSSFVIGSNITFLGETTTIPRDEFNPEEIPGNRIKVFGDLTIGTYIQFTVENDKYWDGLHLYGDQPVTISNCDFDNCNLKNENGRLTVLSSEFNSSYISSKNARLDVWNLNIYGINSCIYCINNDAVSILESTIHDGNVGIQLNSCSSYSITDCSIYNNSSTGISINDSNDGLNVISYTTINNNNGDGIRFYASEGEVKSCTIFNNNRGIICYRGSIVEILKDPNSGSWVYDNVISNNDWEELLFIDDCTIIMDRNRNKIMDNNYISGTWDQYLVRCCPIMSYNQLWRYNYWGYNGSHGAILPPAERFYPSVIDPEPGEIGYILSPVWDPGQPREGEEMLAETLYREADLAVTNNNYTLAEQLFKQVITQYPETEFSPASAKRLIEVSNNYNELQIYYETEPNLHYNDEIDKFTDYLSNYCNIKMENYEEAIYWFEDIIADPTSEIDSVMAIIDAGYTYLLMEENGIRSGFVGNMKHLKPNSREVFEQNQEQLLFSLFDKPLSQPDNEPSENNLPEVPILVGNYPNPFNPTTSISFSIPNESKVDLSVYNIKGQMVKSLVKESFESGNHSVIWDGNNDTDKPVSSGLYFYKLNVNDKTEGIKKMLLLK